MEESIDRRPGWAFVCLSVVYFAVVACLSSVKLLWLDELITLHIARLGGLHAIWSALAQGADPNPPLTHLLVHYARLAFGDHEFVYRLPATIGYWIGMLSLFAYLRRRLPGTWAVAGTVLSMCMAAFDYSFESRSYGIFYGLAMLAFFCWSRAADPQSGSARRLLALLGMTVALAAGISTNYFAVLAFVPIAVGEAVRTWMRWRTPAHVQDAGGWSVALRSIDLRIWLAMGVAATPLIAYRGLIAHSIAQFAPYAWNKVSMEQVLDSYTEMVEIVLYPLLALFVLAIVVAVVERRVALLCRNCRSRVVPRWMEPLIGRGNFNLPIPKDEAAGVFCLMAYPFIGYAIASIRGGMLSPRFVIPVCFGFAIAGTLVAYRVFGGVRRAGLVFLMFVSAWFLCREGYVAFSYKQQKDAFYKLVHDLPQAEAKLPPNAPIEIPDPLLALTFHHYAPPSQAAREIFAVDFPAVRAFRGDDSPEENLWAGRGFLYTLPIQTLAEFQHSTDRVPGEYLIVAGKNNWLLKDLGLHHYTFDRVPPETRAGDIGGFTPLAHGTPEFYTATWKSPQIPPIPFEAADNVPSAKGESLAGESEESKP